MGDVGSARDGAVQRITINRPEVLNALTRSAVDELDAALEEAANPAVRVVVLSGAGRAFCVGQDLRELDGADGAAVGALMRRHYAPVVRRLRTLEKPVLCAVNGAAAGAGVSLALACDVRVASSVAVLVPAFLGVGLVPDVGGSLGLVRALGAPRALEWLLSGRRLAAAEALEWGLVGEVIPEEQWASAVQERAERLAALPTRAVALTKRLLDRAALADLDDQLELEAELQAEAVGTADFAEGARAFLEKREPRFSGR
jgi:2-(1,2-epoxy-1,2-dihydrophenyl)acetyl-CoA isomerase